MTWGKLLVCEIKAIFSNQALLMTVFGGVLLYSFLYPMPYSQQLPREQSVVVVDLDNSAVSRQLIRMVNATPQVQINRYVYNISAAQLARPRTCGPKATLSYTDLGKGLGRWKTMPTRRRSSTTSCSGE